MTFQPVQSPSVHQMLTLQERLDGLEKKVAALQNTVNTLVQLLYFQSVNSHTPPVGPVTLIAPVPRAPITNVLNRIPITPQREPQNVLVEAAGSLSGGEIKLAEEHHKRAYDLDQKSPTVLLGLATCEEAQNNLLKAYYYYQSVLQIEPSNIPAKMGLANIALKRCCYEEAQCLCQEILDKDPNNKELSDLLKKIPKRAEAPSK